MDKTVEQLAAEIAAELAAHRMVGRSHMAGLARPVLIPPAPTPIVHEEAAE
jgi:hypothetical protein